MLVHRRRRWTNIKPTLDERLVFILWEEMAEIDDSR